jgi:ankyrin repeat protein
MFDRIVAGRTDLVFEYLSEGHPANAADANGVALIQWCAYYGDVSAIKHLLANGESLASLGDSALNEAAFHGHWRLCEFLIENGADVNQSLPATGETPLHSALCTTDRLAHDLVIRVLIAHGADPNRQTKPGAETHGFMRDARTRGETPLHRAGAFGSEETIEQLLGAGALLDAKDANGDSPLTWASWYGRPTAILRKLCYSDFHVHPERTSMKAYLLGTPTAR